MSPTEINEILNEINIRLDKIDDKKISAAIWNNPTGGNLFIKQCRNVKTSADFKL